MIYERKFYHMRETYGENSRRRSLSNLFDANCAQLIQMSAFRKNHRGWWDFSARSSARAHLRRDSPFSSMSSRRKTNNRVSDRSRTDPGIPS